MSSYLLYELFELELKEIVAFLTAVVAGTFALWRWTIDQRWRRVQYARELIKEFAAKDSTIKAFQMLDAERYVELFPAEDDKKKRSIYVREDKLIEALRTLKEKTQFPKDEFAIRNIFDEYLTDLSAFQHHIDAKLLKLRDIKPYLEYWIKAMNGYGRVRSTKFAYQLHKFLFYFDFLPIIRLSTAMGYPPPPLTKEDIDLLSSGKAGLTASEISEAGVAKNALPST